MISAPQSIMPEDEAAPEFQFIPHKGKQTQFLQSTADYIFFGGARGGSKSFSLSWKAAFHPRKWHYEHEGAEITKTHFRELKKLNVPGLQIIIDKVSIDYPEYRGLLVRRTFPQLERNIKPETDKLYTPYGAKWKERDHCYVFPSGAKIYLVHCQDMRALSNYIGGNYHFIGVDEANMFPREWIEIIFSSARTTNKELQVFRCLTGNPGDIGHKWLKEDYVEKCKPIPDGDAVYSEDFDVWYQPMKSGKPFKDDGMTFQFIPSLVFDNPSILENDPGYVKFLKKLNPILRSMWLEGNWDVFSGQFFDQWNIMQHVIPVKEFAYRKDFSLATHKLYRFYDYGTHAPFVCVFAAVDSEQNIVIFDEIVMKGLGPKKQAQLVNKVAWERYKLRPTDFYEEIADPKSYWTKSQEKEGGDLWSPADIYELEGITLTPGNNDRKAGAILMYEALSIPDVPEGQYLPPKLRFRDNCEYCINTIPNLPSSPNDPEDVDTKAEDHAFDAIRYGTVRVLDVITTDHYIEKGWRQDVLGSKLAGKSMTVSEYMERAAKSVVKSEGTWRNA